MPDVAVMQNFLPPAFYKLNYCGYIYLQDISPLLSKHTWCTIVRLCLKRILTIQLFLITPTALRYSIFKLLLLIQPPLNTSKLNLCSLSSLMYMTNLNCLLKMNKWNAIPDTSINSFTPTCECEEGIQRKSHSTVKLNVYAFPSLKHS